MGYLNYGGTLEYEFDDRTLAHLRVAIAAKLRRRECFLMSWTNPPERGSGRVSIWIAPDIPLAFRFAGSRPPQIDREWIAVLERLSNTPGGLLVLSAEEAKRQERRHDRDRGAASGADEKVTAS